MPEPLQLTKDTASSPKHLLLNAAGRGLKSWERNELRNLPFIREKRFWMVHLLQAQSGAFQKAKYLLFRSILMSQK